MSREEWLRLRAEGVGGSDVGAICGLSHFSKPIDVYLTKTGATQAQQTSEAMYWGSTLEDVVAREFQIRTGKKVQRLNFLIKKDGWQIANVDRLVVNPDIAKSAFVAGKIKTDTLLECKTANSFAVDEWGPSQEAEILTGNVVSQHRIPESYECQIQWYMGIIGAKRCYVAVLIGGNDYRMYQVDFSPETYAALVEKCRTFWFENVQKLIAPELETSEDVEKVYPDSTEEFQEAPDDVISDIADYRDTQARINLLKQVLDKKKALICEAIKERAGLSINGQPVCTWKAQKSTRFDATAFKNAHPDLYNEFTKTTQTRVFRLTIKE